MHFLVVLWNDLPFLKKYHSTGCSKKFVPGFFGYCGGAVDSNISAFLQLHTPDFKL